MKGPTTYGGVQNLVGYDLAKYMQVPLSSDLTTLPESGAKSRTPIPRKGKLEITSKVAAITSSSW